MGVPEHLVEEQLVVEAEIRRAFRGVTRKGGVSWSEAREIDNYEGEEKRAIARARDTEKSWEELVDDPTWNHEVLWIGGFCFLDAIGYRYYIAPAMIRCCREGGGELMGYALEVRSDYEKGQIKLIDDEQSGAIARFVKFMIVVHEAKGDDIYGESWQNAFAQHWGRWEGKAS